MAKLDSLDLAILSELKKDSRASNVSIASSVDSSEGTVRGRIKRLVADGIIQSFTIKLRGANVRAIIEVTVSDETATNEAAIQISKLEGVSEILEVTGETDLLIFVDVENTEALNQLIDGIRIVAGTKSTQTRVILSEVSN